MSAVPTSAQNVAKVGFEPILIYCREMLEWQLSSAIVKLLYKLTSFVLRKIEN